MGGHSTPNRASEQGKLPAMLSAGRNADDDS
jgi:hypothetical protein